MAHPPLFRSIIVPPRGWLYLSFAFSRTRREPIPPRPSAAAVGLERKAPPNVSPSGVAKGRYMVPRLGGLLDEQASGIRVRGTARRLTPNTSCLRQPA